MTRAPRWTPEEDATIRKLAVEDGLREADIAKKVARSPKAIRHRLNQLGAVQRGPKLRTPEEMARMRAGVQHTHTPEAQLKRSKTKRRPPRSAVKMVRDLMMAFDQTSDMTMQDLARKLGVIPNTIHNWRHGVSTPRVDQIEAMAQVIGCEVVVQPIPVDVA